MGGAIERAHSIAKSHSVALSRLRLPLELYTVRSRVWLHQTSKAELVSRCGGDGFRFRVPTGSNSHYFTGCQFSDHIIIPEN